MKKALSLILAVIMCLSVAVVIPISASAKNVEIAETSAAKLAAPKITKLTSTASGVKITIGKVNGAAKYAYFFLSNHKWKKIGVTAATSFVHKGVTSGKRYIYTIRCVASNGKTFTSAYNKKGWVITYKKPAVWPSMYYNYLKRNNFKVRWSGSTYKIESNIPLALHDFDLNGIPELIIGYIGARLGLAVYTIYNGKVVYAGCIGGKSTYYSDNKKYHGLFRSDSWKSGAEGCVVYSQISKGKLVTKEVERFEYDIRSTPAKKKTTILNKTLHSVSEKCMTTKYYNGYKTTGPKNGLKLYYWRDIQSKGWNSFIKYYGY